MRSIPAPLVAALVEKLALDVAFSLGQREITAIRRALDEETSPRARYILEAILENSSVASARRLPLCQDCGSAVVFVERGDRVVIEGAGMCDAINEGVRSAYEKGFLRKSMLAGALDRRNTGDNTPAFIHCECAPGDVFRVKFAAKGGGAENTSALAMLPPAAGRSGVIDFVVDTVRRAGGRPCPPLVLGVAVGGNFETAPLLAKKALFRPLADPNPVPRLAEMERVILAAINDLGIGPMGLGGCTTALAVHLEEAPCHIATLPVAVNVQCHSHRHAEGSL
ncbi:MAG TPA: fumarate hydratase [Planctomycetes bacterium]|nr:fumarate hydratase [Planctomycetota bacterium]